MHQPEISKDAVRNAIHVEKIYLLNVITARRYKSSIENICRAYIVARMKQHHKCMGRTALGCTAWGCTAWGCTAWGCTAWGCTAWTCTTWGCTAWDCTAWGCTACMGLYCMGLHCMGLHCIGCIVKVVCFFLFGGGGEVIPLSLGRACLIKPQFIITVINADCRITKS